MAVIKKELAHLDIQNVAMTYLELMEWVIDNAPKGTKLENLQIDFDTETIVDLEWGRDTDYVNSVMTLSVLEEE